MSAMLLNLSQSDDKMEKANNNRTQSSSSSEEGGKEKTRRDLAFSITSILQQSQIKRQCKQEADDEDDEEDRFDVKVESSDDDEEEDDDEADEVDDDVDEEDEHEDKKFSPPFPPPPLGAIPSSLASHLFGDSNPFQVGNATTTESNGIIKVPAHRPPGLPPAFPPGGLLGLPPAAAAAAPGSDSPSSPNSSSPTNSSGSAAFSAAISAAAAADYASWLCRPPHPHHPGLGLPGGYLPLPSNLLAARLGGKSICSEKCNKRTKSQTRDQVGISCRRSRCMSLVVGQKQSNWDMGAYKYARA